MRRLLLFNYPAPFTGLNTFEDAEIIKNGQSPGEYNISHYLGILSPALGINYFSFPGQGMVTFPTPTGGNYPMVGYGTAFTTQLSVYSPLQELTDGIDVGNLISFKVTSITNDTTGVAQAVSANNANAQGSYNIFQFFPYQIIKLDSPYLSNKYLYFAITTKYIYELNTSTNKWYATYYAAGTITTDGATKTIVGTNTLWTKYVTPLSSIVFGGVAYTVKTITDDTHLVLSDTDPIPPLLNVQAYKLYLNTGSSIATTTVFLNNGANTYYVSGNGGLYKYNSTLDCFYIFTPQWAIPSGSAYITGTITTTGSDTTVTGAGTAWISSGHVVPGSIIQISGINYIVQTVSSDTVLTVNFAPPQFLAATSYSIYLPTLKILASEIISNHENHLVLGRVTREDSTTDYYKLYFSDINNDVIWGGDDFSNDADIVTFQSTTDQVQAIVPLYQYLVVFKNNSIHLMTYQGLPIIYSDQLINTVIGTIYPFSVVSVNNLIFFIGNDNVYVFDGNTTTPIGTEIRKDLFAVLANSSNVQAIYDYNNNSYLILISATSGNPYIYTFNTLTKSWYKTYSVIGNLIFSACGYYYSKLSVLTWSNYIIVMETSPYKWNQLTATANYPVPIGTITVGSASLIVTYGQVIINMFNAFTNIPFTQGGTVPDSSSQMQYWLSKPFTLSKDGRPVRMERIRFNQPLSGRKCRLYCTLSYGDDRGLEYSISGVVDLNTTNYWDFSVKGVWFQLAIDADGGPDNLTGYDVSAVEFYYMPIYSIIK